MYSKCVILPLSGLDSLYPSDAFNFQDIGLRHKVNNLGHRASPCGRPLLNLMTSEILYPSFVLAVIFVFQLSHSLATVLHIHKGNLCIVIISCNQAWLTESNAFRTSIQAMLRFLLPFRLSRQTILSIIKLSMVPLHLVLAPLCSSSNRLCVSRCSSIGDNKQVVNHLYCVFKQVIGLWFWLESSPGLGIRLVFPPVNQLGYPTSPVKMVLKLAAVPSCKVTALFHQ